MTVYLFDTNIYNHILDHENSDEIKEFIKGLLSSNMIEIRSIYDVRRQLEKTSCRRRRKNLICLYEIITTTIPSETFIIGHTRLGEGKLGTGKLMGQIRGNMKNDRDKLVDSLIGEASRNADYLVTDDCKKGGLSDAAKKVLGPSKVICLKEFLRMIEV